MCGAAGCGTRHGLPLTCMRMRPGVACHPAGCTPDAVLVLRDHNGRTICRLRAVRAILAAWSPVLRTALELGGGQGGFAPPNSNTDGAAATTSSASSAVTLAHSSSTGCLMSYTSCGGAVGSGSYHAIATAGCSSATDCPAGTCGLVEVPLQVDSHKEVEAWKVAMCLMHPMDPNCGRTPSALITTCAIKPLVTLADKYNLQVRGVL
jgi:hypothetical protein